MILSACFKQTLLALLAVCVAWGAVAQDDFDRTRFANETSEVDSARLDQALAGLEADDRLQRERPEAEPEPFEVPEPESPSEPNWFLQAIADILEALGGILGYLLAAIVGIAVLAGLYMMFGDSLDFRRRDKDAPPRPDISEAHTFRPVQARAKALLEDADALAAEGRFAEAVHLLLFRSIDEIQEKRSGVIGRALTAREIGELGTLPSPVRAALLPIIRIVERSFFGGRDVTETGWQEARSSYESFAFGEAWA